MRKGIRIFVAMVMILIMVTACGTSDIVLTIDEHEVSMGDGIFVLREMESMYENQYGPTIWTTGFEGKTFSDIAKEAAIDSLTRLYITSLEAQARGIELTDADQTEIDTMQEEYLALVTEAALEADGISLENLRNILTYNYYGQKLMDIELADFEVDQALLDEALLADVNYQSIQDYGYEGVLEEVTAQFVLIATVNEDGSQKSDDEKVQALEMATELLEAYKSGSKTFDQLVEDNLLIEESKNIITFYKGDREPEVEDAVFNMEIDEVSELILTEFGYYIIKKIDHIYPTDEEVKNVMEVESYLVEQYGMAQRQEAYNDLYEVWKEKYQVVLVEKVWEDAMTSYEQLEASGALDTPAE